MRDFGIYERNRRAQDYLDLVRRRREDKNSFKRQIFFEIVFPLATIAIILSGWALMFLMSAGVQ